MPETSSLLVTAASATSSYVVLIVLLFEQKNMNMIMRLVCESCNNASPCMEIGA